MIKIINRYPVMLFIALIFILASCAPGNEKFDVDGILHVIENKAIVKDKEKRSWLNQILGIHKKVK